MIWESMRVQRLGSVETEIQLVDASTEQANSRGENSHERYKARQRVHVRRRLEGINSVEERLPRFEEIDLDLGNCALSTSKRTKAPRLIRAWGAFDFRMCKDSFLRARCVQAFNEA